MFYDSTGTGQFIRSNVKFVNECTEEVPTTCNEDTGSCKTLHSWSRGVFLVVSAGGHMEYWQPLYSSAYDARCGTGFSFFFLSTHDNCTNIYIHWILHCT